MTRHVDTGAPLAARVFDKMVAAKNFQSGLAMLRQLEFACSTCGCIRNCAGANGAAAAGRSQAERIAVLHPPAYNRFPNNFSHSFAGGYAAGYYSYKWAEVLSADAYSFFEEHGILDRRAASASATRSSRSAAAARRRNRSALSRCEPTSMHLLRHNGIPPRSCASHLERQFAARPGPASLLDWHARSAADVACLQERKPRTRISRR